jgi:VCBS repeat-containing protein
MRNSKRTWLQDVLTRKLRSRLSSLRQASARSALSAKLRCLRVEGLERRELMAANLFNDSFQLTNANASYSPEIALNVLANDNNGAFTQLVSAANIDSTASNKTANTATYVHLNRTGTTTPQRSMIAGGVTFRSTSNFGDIDLGTDTDDLNNNSVPATHDRTQGMILGLNRENTVPNNTGNTATNLAVLNYNSTFFSSVSAPGNDGEIMVRPGVARFPYSQGWIGGSYDGTGAATFGNAAFTVVKSGTGQYDVAVEGVTDSRRDGFLFSIGEGNSDNYSRAVPLGGNSYRVVMRDNAATFTGGEDGGINLLYVPRSAQGLVGGHVRGDSTIANPMIQSFGDFTVQRTSNGNWTMSVPGHTPETGVLIIESADFDRTRGANVYFSHQAAANGTDFLIRQIQFEGTQANLLNDDFVVFFVPFENQLAPSSPLTITEVGTSGAPNSGLSTNGVPLTIQAGGTIKYDYAFASLRSLPQGATVVDTFVYTASDGLNTSTATATVTLKGTNDAPILSSPIPAVSLVEDGSPLNVDLTTHFTEYDTGDLLSYSVSLSTGAPVSVSFAGNVATFTPLADQHGAFSFTITATDALGASVTTALTTGSVEGVVEGAKAVADSAQTTKDGVIDISVLGNDFDPENSTFSVASANVNGNIAGTSNATTVWSILQSSAAPNNLQIGSLPDLGDVSLNRNGTSLQQSLGVLIGTPSDNTTPYATVNTYGNILNSTSGYWVATDSGSGGNAERNTPFSSAFFPFSEGWTSGHVDSSGILRTGRGVAQANISRVTAGLYEITIPAAVDSTSSGLLFATTASNDDNILSVRSIPGTNRWQVRNNDNDFATGFEDDGISFVYIPATTPNLIAGRWSAGSGSLVQSFGGISASADANGTVTLTIPGQTPTTGALIALDSGTTTDSVNGNVVEVPTNYAVMHTAVGDSYAITLRLGNTFTQTQGDVQFLFLPFNSPLERLAPNPFSVTSFDSLSQFNATITLNPNGSLKYNPLNAGGAIAALGPGQSLVDTFSYTITDANGQTSTTTVSVTVSGDRVVVTPSTGLITTEAGGTATFDIVLSVVPSADVTINLTSSNPAEGVTSVNSVVFTSTNWNVPQTVTVVGQNDFVVDGNINYSIITAATSPDPLFNGVTISDVSLVNNDNDVASIAVSPTSGLNTTERGGTATFSVVLTSLPSATVTFGLSSSDLTEGTVSPASLVFDSANWNVPQLVTVTGVDDTAIDGDISFAVVTDAATSADPLYNGLNPANVSVVNRDFDINIAASSGVTQYGLGQAGVGIDGRFSVLGTNAFLTNGTLTVTVTQNGSTNDRFEIRNEGTGAGQVGVAGSDVSFGGTTVGSFSGGAGAPLVVTFNSSADRAALQAIARAVTYRDINVSAQGNRTVRFAVVDGDGVATTQVEKTVRVGLKRVLELQQGIDRGFGVYSGARDIALSQSSPNSSFPIGANAAEGLLVDWPDDGATNKSQVLLRFEDLIGNALGQIPTDAIITSASLFVNTNNTGDGARFHRMLQTWSDTTSTWNNWGGGIDADGIEARSNPESIWGTLDVSGATGGGFAGVSVTKDVRAWRNNEANFGWLLEPHVGGTDGWGFSPSEAAVSSQRPLLRVEWVPAGTQSVVFQQDVNDYTGIQDTNIASNLVTSQADALTIGTDFEDATTSRLQSLIRFNDIIGSNAGQVPSGAIIHDAILTLATFGNNGVGDGGSFHRMNVDWTEDALWTTFTDGIQADGSEAATGISFQAGNASRDPDAQAGLVDFEVIGDIQAWADGTPNYGWAALPWTSGTNGWFFYSSENTFDEQFTPRPKLEVFYTVPVNQPPTDIALSSSAIPENAGGNATVGSLSTIDPDAGNTFSYTLVAGNGDSDNAAFNIDGSTLRATNSFDFEAKSSYSVRIRSTDQGGLYTEKSLIITVTNVNESPTIVSGSAYSVTESNTIGIQGGQSSATPYLTSRDPNVQFTSILTVGDAVNGYQMVGIPDGMGAYDNSDGTFTLLLNHEIVHTAGIARAHGQPGAFVSKWVINKSTLQVVSIQDFLQNGTSVYLSNNNPSAATSHSAYLAAATTLISRLCSADLAMPSAYQWTEPGTGTVYGTSSRIFQSGEESGGSFASPFGPEAEILFGRQFAFVATDDPNTALNEAGTAWELPHAGLFPWENNLASPFAQRKTIVAGMDDSTGGQVYFWVGDKQTTGNVVERAGLTRQSASDALYVLRVSNLTPDGTGATNEDRNTPLSGAFTLENEGDVSGITFAGLEALSDSKGGTQFFRPEDGQWDPDNPADYYFVTTDRYDQVQDGVGPTVGRSRLYRLRFTDITNPTAGGTITAVLDGSEGGNMFDNMTVSNGKIIIQEDVGNQQHLGKIWRYDIAADTLTEIAQHDRARFGDVGVPPISPFSADEESSGVIDVSSILGAGSYLLNVQAHYPTTVELVEGGQLLLMKTNVASGQSLVGTPVASDPDAGSVLTWSIAGGSDQAKFVIDPASGRLSFAVAPSFESPSDANADNVYLVDVSVSDGTNTATKSLEVTVAAVNESPTNTTAKTVSMAENTTAVLIATGTDPESAALTWAISGGADATKFTINATTGELAFTSAPNFEAPTDNGANNSYFVTVTCSDGVNPPVNKTVIVSVTNVNESPALTRSESNVSGNVFTTLANAGTWSDPEGQSVSLSASLGTVTKNGDGTWSWSFIPTQAYANQTVTITGNDGTNSSQVQFTIDALVAVVNTKVYYKGSSFAGSSVDDALDTSKSLARSGSTERTLTFDNLINSNRGINGLVIDVAGLVGTTLTDADFMFRVSPTGSFNEATNPPSSWQSAPRPTLIDVIPGGTTGPSRVRLEWADNAIADRWLQIKVLANANTGLRNPDVYYIGHLLGETSGTTSGGNFLVQIADITPVRQAVGTLASVNSRLDITKNGLIQVADIVAMRSRVGVASLRAITIPVSGSGAEGESIQIPLMGAPSIDETTFATLGLPPIGMRWTGLNYDVQPLSSEPEVPFAEVVEAPTSVPAIQHEGISSAAGVAEPTMDHSAIDDFFSTLGRSKKSKLGRG